MCSIAFAIECKWMQTQLSERRRNWTSEGENCYFFLPPLPLPLMLLVSLFYGIKGVPIYAKSSSRSTRWAVYYVMVANESHWDIQWKIDRIDVVSSSVCAMCTRFYRYSCFIFISFSIISHSSPVAHYWIKREKKNHTNYLPATNGKRREGKATAAPATIRKRNSHTHRVRNIKRRHEEELCVLLLSVYLSTARARLLGRLHVVRSLVR